MLLTRARARQAASVAPWAELLPEVVQQVAGLQDDEDRDGMLRSCTAWCAAIQAVPALWPETVLRGPNLDFGAWSWDEHIPFDGVQQTLVDGGEESQALLERAAGLDRLVWRVRIIHCYQQPMLVHALVGVLPPTVRQLHLEADCCGPLCSVLQHITQLDSLSIGGAGGNGANMVWRGRGAAFVLPKLTSLSLNFRDLPWWDGDQHQDAIISSVPGYLPDAFAAATRLSSLKLRARWEAATAQLCAALPALEDLRLTIYECTNAQAVEAVAALEQLLQLRALALTIHCAPSGVGYDVVDIVELDDWEHTVHLPPMAQLADRLTALTLAGAASLPPDWRQLRGLQELHVFSDEDAPDEDPGAGEGERPGFGWGTGSLSTLTALARLHLSHGTLLPDPAEVATAPQLKRLWAPGAYRTAWENKMRRLRPDITLKFPVDYA